MRNEGERLAFETEEALKKDKQLDHAAKKRIKDDIAALRKAVTKTKPEEITREQAEEIRRLCDALKASAAAIHRGEDAPQE